MAETCAARRKGVKSSKSSKVAAAALFALAGASAHAGSVGQQLVDGQGGGGCMVGVSGCVLPTSNAIYTNFYTQGGAGSGGGAGLGGVFFVNSNASLNLSNVTFQHDTVKGGDGGSTPDIVVNSASLPLSDKTASVASVTAFQVAPTIVTVGATLEVTGVTLSSSNPLLKAGSVVSLGGTDNTTTIGSISGNSVTFGQAVAIDASAIKAVGSATYTTGTNTVTSSSFASLAPSDLSTGMTVIGAGIPDGTTVTAVTRDNNNNIQSVTLSNNVTTSALANGSLQFVNVSSFNASQFVTTGNPNQISLSATGLGLAVGMTLSGDGVPAGTTVTAISGDVVTLSHPITGLSFTGSLPVGAVGGNTIQLAAPDNRFTVGTPVSGSGIPAGTTVIGVDPQTGALTLSANLTAVPTNLSTQTVLNQSGSTLTLRNAAGLQAGMTLQGAGIPDGTTILSVSGNNVTLSATPSGSVSGFVASSPLNTGGSLNNIAATGSHGSNGSNGLDGDPVVVWITDGEGRTGTNGANGGNGTNAAGGRGGNGGGGSSGAPFNYGLTMDTIHATEDAVQNTADAAGALATFPPNAVLSAAHIAAAAVSYVDLGVAIVNLADWGADLALGLAGRGGDGATGGRGGNGSAFYGGGAGGNGGDGGKGALSITDGGTGGAGGNGGTGGFGAGGGSGGSGGDGGNSGNSVDGTPGAGGIAGFGGGVGSDGTGLNGGGGSGLGGAIFVRSGGTLTISGDSLFSDNTVLGGSSNNGGAAGQAAGSDIFMMKGSTVSLQPGVGHTIRVEGTIADDSTASIANGSYAPGAGADLHIGGGGLVQLVGANTYTGKTYIEGATLQADIGQGVNNASSVVFAGAGTLGTLNETNAGVLLTAQAVTERAGTLPGQFSWNGAGGFAAATADGLTVDFGRTSNGPSETLQWGSSYLATNSTMVFGSAYAQGSVTLDNDINLNGQTGNVAVIDSQQAVNGQLVNATATLSGNLTNGSLHVGSAGYDGTLYLTGQDSLSAITVDSGMVNTRGTDASGHLLANGGNVTVNGGTLVLGDVENAGNVNVAAGGQLLSSGGMTATTVDNSGLIQTLSLQSDTSFGSATNRANALLNVMGTTNVTGTLDNQALGSVWQSAQMTTGSVNNDGQWVANGTQTLNTATLTGQGEFLVANASDQLTVNQSGNSSFGGDFAGAGNVVKDGNGTLTLTGASTNTGGIEVKGGTLDTTGGGTLADTGAITVDQGATFVAGTTDTVGDVTNAGTLRVNAALNVASLTNQATGAATLNADVTATGNVSNRGTMDLYADIQAAGVDNGGTLNVHGQRTITTDGFSGDTTGQVVLGSARLPALRLAFPVANAQLTIAQSGDSTYAGQINGQGSLVKTGAGTLNLTGSNGFTGGLTVAGGTVDTTGGGTLADTGAITIDNGATFVGGTVDTVGAVNNMGTLTVNAAQDVASLVNSGTTNVNATLTSDSTVNNTAAGTINQAANIVATGTVTNDGVINVSGGQTINSGGFQGAGTAAIAAGSVLAVQQDADSTYAGTFTGDGALVKDGSGTLTLTGANTHTGGTLVNAGTLDTTGGGTLADTGAVGINAGATFRAGTADTIGDVINEGTLQVNAAQSVASLTNLSGGVAQLNADVTSGGNVANGGTIEQSADLQAAVVDNSGALNVHGQRTINTGAFTGNANGQVNLATGGDQLTVNQSGDSSYAGQIAGQGTFVKSGAGTLTLTGASTGTGTLAVNAGTVEVAGSVASTNVQVAQGASLGVAANALAGNAALSNAGTLNVRADNTVASFTNSGTMNGPGKLTAATYQLNDGSVINGNLGAGTLTTQGNVLLNGTSDAQTVDVQLNSTLTLGGAQRLAQQAGVTVDGALVLAAGDQTIATLSGDGSVNMNAYHLNVTNGGNFSGTLTSTNGSSLALDGASLGLTNGSTVSTETVALTNGSSMALTNGTQLNAGSVTVASGSTLTLAAGSTLSYQTLSGSGTVDAAQFQNAAGSKVSGSLVFTGDLTNTGTLQPGTEVTPTAQAAVMQSPATQDGTTFRAESRAAVPVAAAATYAPGVVTILGNYTETAALNLGLAGTQAGQYDQVRVGGTATATPSSVLTFSAENGVMPVAGNVYQVISDLNGGAKRINGAFGDVVFDADGQSGAGAPVHSAAIVMDLGTGQAIATGLNQAGSTFADLGHTTAQHAAAAALLNAASVGVDQIDSTQTLGRAAAEVLTTSNGVQKLAPEYYGGMVDYGYSVANDSARQLVKRAATSFGEATPVGGAHFIADLKATNQSPASGTSLSRDDLTVGGEWQATPTFAFGGLFTLSSGSLGGDFGSGKADGQALRVYGKGYLTPRVTVLAGVGHGSYSYNLTRDAVSAQATGSTRGSGTDFNLGVAYDAYRQGGLSVAPYLSLDRGNFGLNGFAEQGGSDQRLVLDGYGTTRTTATLGTAFNWQKQFGGRAVQLTVDGALQSVLQEGNRAVNASLGVDNSVQFPLTFESRKRTVPVVGFAGTVDLGKGLSASASVDAALSDRRDDSVRFNLTKQF